MKNFFNFFYCIVLSVIVFPSSIIHSQPYNGINVNPDPNGEPWIADGYYKIPENAIYMTQEEISAILAKQKRALPSRVDNHKLSYARKPFNQVGGSCGSASRICYMFAYEVNNYYRRDGNKPENIYPSHFTWMLTSQGSEKEAMARDNGVPNSILYGGELYSKIYGTSGQDGFSTADYGWMQGYDKWYGAMQNRITGTKYLKFQTVADLEVIKGWFYNHNGDTSFAAGGYSGFGCASSGYKSAPIPAGNYEAGKKILTSWGPQLDHGTVYCGYDDSVGYDFNNDGKITNDGDIKNWERGALIFLNSWSGTWENSGTLYVPYRLAVGTSHELYLLRKDYKPKRVMKIIMNYTQRAQIRLSVGVNANVAATTPSKTLICQHFNYGGRGNIDMLGKWADGKIHTEPMEFGYDVTDVASALDLKKDIKYFLVIDSKTSAAGTGTVSSISVIDYQNSQSGVETVTKETNVAVKGGGQQTLVSVVVPGVAAPVIDHFKNSSASAVSYLKHNNIITLKFPASQRSLKQISVGIVNAQGKLIRYTNQVQYKNGLIKAELNISGLAKGIYLCTVKGEGVSLFTKILL